MRALLGHQSDPSIEVTFNVDEDVIITGSSSSTGSISISERTEREEQIMEEIKTEIGQAE